MSEEAEDSDDSDVLGCCDCDATIHFRSLSSDYIYFENGWFLDPAGGLCDKCAPSESEEEDEGSEEEVEEDRGGGRGPH